MLTFCKQKSLKTWNVAFSNIIYAKSMQPVKTFHRLRALWQKLLTIIEVPKFWSVGKYETYTKLHTSVKTTKNKRKKNKPQVQNKQKHQQNK